MCHAPAGGAASFSVSFRAAARAHRGFHQVDRQRKRRSKRSFSMLMGTALFSAPMLTKGVDFVLLF